MEGPDLAAPEAPPLPHHPHTPIPDPDPNMDPHADALLAGLTPDQRAAVVHGDGPLLVLAAAGSGKTRVITRRIAWLIAHGNPPWSILALTFTNKAAGEMRERVVAQILGDAQGQTLGAADRRIRGLTVTTFHSLCARLLRRYAEAGAVPGVRHDYTIYNTSDQLALVKQAVVDADLSTTNWPRAPCSAPISSRQERPRQCRQLRVQRPRLLPQDDCAVQPTSAGLRRANAVDFDDLLLLTATMLRDHEEIRRQCQDRWRHLLIDEYQDTNRAQFEIARLLAGEGRRAESTGLPGVGEDDEDPGDLVGPNICVVGDPDQAIYGWRGADIANILDFERHFPSARTVKLGQNFRSTEPILAVADTLIKRNKRRKDKPLYTDRHGGERVTVTLCRDEHHESRLIADWFKRLDDDGDATWRDMAVFYRTNALSRVIEDAFRLAQIPYVIARGTAFYDREEVRDAISYLRVVANPADNVSLARIVNKPTRGIGKSSLDQVVAFATREQIPVFAAMRRARELDLPARALTAIFRFVELIDTWTGAGSFMGASVSGTLHELVGRVIDESGLAGHYKKQAVTSGMESDEERLDNMDELVSGAREFEDEFDPTADAATALDPDRPEAAAVPALLAVLRAFLESVALVADADKVDPERGAVTLMTLHAAKGLEFDAVAMIGLEEGLLPHSRAFDTEEEMEEERRLAFVGITRARKLLQITSAKYRTVRGATERTIPSRFLGELGSEHVVTSDQGDDFDAEPEERGYDRGGALATRESLERIREQRRTLATTASDLAREEFPAGSVVRHPQFGDGVVQRVIGGQNARAVIKFRSVGEKTLVLEYARLRRVR
ncbi:MAG: UvrD-helicase domain-containing protein [Phycisphaerales bacterium]